LAAFLLSITFTVNHSLLTLLCSIIQHSKLFFMSLLNNNNKKKKGNSGNAVNKPGIQQTKGKTNTKAATRNTKLTGGSQRGS